MSLGACHKYELGKISHKPFRLFPRTSLWVLRDRRLLVVLSKARHPLFLGSLQDPFNTVQSLH